MAESFARTKRRKVSPNSLYTNYDFIIGSVAEAELSASKDRAVVKGNDRLLVLIEFEAILFHSQNGSF